MMAQTGLSTIHTKSTKKMARGERAGRRLDAKKKVREIQKRENLSGMFNGGSLR